MIAEQGGKMLEFERKLPSDSSKAPAKGSDFVVFSCCFYYRKMFIARLQQNLAWFAPASFRQMENGAWSKMGLDQALGLKKKKNSAKYSDPGCHCSCNLDFSGSGWAPNETNFSKKKPAGEGLFPASPNFLSERKKQTSSTVALR